MRIAIASGKGGTGKTTVAVNLAFVAARDGRSVTYLDCDVEAPNGHIFLKPQITGTSAVYSMVPKVDEGRCSLCRRCAEVCRFSAIVCIGTQVLVFPELCHACGGCSLVCEDRAITEVRREVGALAVGNSGRIQFVQGRLNLGEVKSPHVIKAVKAAAPPAELSIIDAPPGTSCPVIESVRDSDFVLLVTEPTPFGLHDLKLAVELVRALELAFGVIINRADAGDGAVRAYCREERIEVLAEIPNDREIAEAYSRGELICQTLPRYDSLFGEISSAIVDMAPGRIGVLSDA